LQLLAFATLTVRQQLQAARRCAQVTNNVRQQNSTMRVTHVLLAIGVALVSMDSLSQRVARPAEVFGNSISKEADEWLTDSNVQFNKSLEILQSKWTSGTTQVQVLLPEKKVVFLGPKVRVVFDALIIGTVRNADQSWEWGWNNPNIQSDRVVPAPALQAVGKRFDLRYLQHGMVPLPDEHFATFLSGIALKVHGGVSVYVSSGQGLQVYLLLSNPRRTDA
jgi:hypothetical protein